MIRMCAASTRRSHAARGFFVLATAMFAAAAAFYFVITAERGSLAFALPLALFWGCVIFMIDRELVGGWSLRTAWIRLALSFILGITVAIPAELRLLEGRIDQQIERDSMSENAAARNRMQQRTAQLDAQRAELESQLAEIRRQVQETGRNREAEVVGRVIQGQTTGIAGEGPAFRAAEERLKLLQAQSADVAAALARVNQERPRAAEDYQKEQIGAIYDFPSRYEALKRATPAFTPLWTLSWLLTLVIILVDMLPVIMKVQADPSDYDYLLRIEVEENIHRAQRMAEHHAKILQDDFLNPQASTVNAFESAVRPSAPAGSTE